MVMFRYRNPITRDPALSMRDHQVIRVDNAWYMTGTSAPIWKGKNPGVRLLKSQNLLDWFHCEWLIDSSKLPDDCFYNGRFWAPEIHRAHGRYWLTVNCGNGTDGKPERMQAHAIVLFSSDQVTGPYELVTRDRPIGVPFKNDASLFTDDDGRSYLYCSGGGLWQAEIDLPAGRLVAADDLQKILSPRDHDTPEWMMGGIEGPFVIKRNGTYYMFFSAWTRGYEVGVLSAPAPLGPWNLMDGSPIFGSRKRRYREPQMVAGGYAHVTFEDTPDPFVEVGHCAIFEGPDGGDWICCHYFLEGKQPLTNGPVIEYADTEPQLGFEPLRFDGKQFSVNGPTWTEQTIELP